MVKLNVKKEYVIPYDNKETEEYRNASQEVKDSWERIKFSITWKFPFTTSSESVQLRKTLRGEGKDHAEISEHVFLHAMKEQDGFCDENGTPLNLSDIEHRMSIYDAIKPFTGYMTKVQCACLGPKGKNLLAGLTARLTGNGTPAIADSASANVSKDNVPTS